MTDGNQTGSMNESYRHAADGTEEQEMRVRRILQAQVGFLHLLAKASLQELDPQQSQRDRGRL
ncbi:MAG: hypothetical protein LLG01_16725 [Planctomycetaceae bacterium]|nr:hypothetical protein [Planctomycetaceae bacterium]